MNEQEAELIETLGSFAYDPLGFTRWAFPWGEPGELARYKEPYPWQCEYLEELGDKLIQKKPVLLSTTSGHGTGKSALNGMETWALFSTLPGTRGVITANTENQLRTKTWVEMAKWHRLFIAKDLFKYTATALFSVDEQMAKEWRIDLVPWSERNTEAFAGLHNAGKRVLILFDEASAIPDIIWETTEGALTDEDTEIIWSVKGNPTRNSGRFRECFPGGKFAHRWSCREINSMDVPGTNKQQLEEWIEDYGVDSDFCRIRIFGKFPRQDQSAFIPLELAREAAKRQLTPSQEQVVLGVDVGRFGDDPSVIYARQGNDARSRSPEVYQGLDTTALADRVMSALHRYNATQVFVDEGGVGGGVVDRLALLGCPVIGVQFGGRADNSNAFDAQTKYANKRAEMWGALKNALPRLCIVDSVRGLEKGLVDELAAPTYDYQSKTEALVLESKKAMKARGVPSPNVADALALTYAYPSLTLGSTRTLAAEYEYDPFSAERMAS